MMIIHSLKKNDDYPENFIRNIPELLYLEPVEQHLNLQLNLLAPLRQVYRVTRLTNIVLLDHNET